MNSIIHGRSLSNISMSIHKDRPKMIDKQGDTQNQNRKQKSYSILQFQMENDGKISISTNRRVMRAFSATKMIERPQSNLVNTQSIKFLYSPPKIPSPKHSILLQKKTHLIKLPPNVRKSQQYLLNDILSNKPINQVITKRTKISRRGGQEIQQSISPSTYPLMFSEIQRDPLKFQNQAHQFSILYNSQYLRKFLKNDQRQ